MAPWEASRRKPGRNWPYHLLVLLLVLSLFSSVRAQLCKFHCLLNQDGVQRPLQTSPSVDPARPRRGLMAPHTLSRGTMVSMTD